METTSHLSPIVVGSFVLYSIFDDSDGMYHSDAITHQTPAEERQQAHAEDKTKA